MTRWHPWRTLRDTHPDVSVTCRYYLPGDLKGVWTDDGIYLHRGLDQAGRRSVLTHELVHRERGTECNPHDRFSAEERIVDEIASRRLIPIEALLDALIWTRFDVGQETAGELWCDVHMVIARIQGLTAEERRYIDDELKRRQP
ncbi:hypothetical protein [Rhodococcus sp. B10]|uniref:hypothetical protein n=1 Tax=Rhodococcus sp. B10 TaxID=2695876 RepID=UPI0014305FC7|nr:hypothetical protein [Rhodococcus sp. B10]NIL77679.1 hypothetical protein [Rhodococcus sp. B10]